MNKIYSTQFCFTQDNADPFDAEKGLAKVVWIGRVGRDSTPKQRNAGFKFRRRRGGGEQMPIDKTADIEQARRWFAEELRHTAHVRSLSVVEAFATVPP